MDRYPQIQLMFFLSRNIFQTSDMPFLGKVYLCREQCFLSDLVIVLMFENTKYTGNAILSREVAEFCPELASRPDW